MSAITREHVAHAARLARVKLDDDEIARITRDLERVVGYVEQLMAVDVEGVEPMTQPFIEPVRRDDKEGAAVLGRAAVSGGPGFDPDSGLVRVPKVIAER